MPREARLNGNVRSFIIANFTDHHHIRILAEDCPETSGKCHICFGIDLGLTDPLNVILDRIFHCQDVPGPVIQLIKAGIQGCGFTGSGRSRNKKDPMRPADNGLHGFHICRVHTQMRQIPPAFLLIKQAHYHSFTVAGRNSRDPHVNFFTTNADRYSTILWQSFFRDIQFRHHLDS